MSVRPTPKSPRSIHTPAEELDLLQKEYEKFVYIVSHDFGAPLRHITQFSEILIKRLNGKIDHEDVKYLQPIQSAVQQCEAMLEAMLVISRLNTRPNPFTEIDLQLLVQKVVRQLTPRTEQLLSAFTIGALPTIMGDAPRIELLFTHLLRNAATYIHPDRPLAITITAESGIGSHTIHVQDNGLSIAPEYQDEIFTIFKRLNPKEHARKVGAGLTICQKIMQLHGGSITCVSDGKNGSTFSCIFPIF